MLAKLKQLDAFTKIDPSHCRPSVAGAITTCIVYATVFLLFCHQLFHFIWHPTLSYTNAVDSRLTGTVPLEVDMIVNAPCSQISFTLEEAEKKPVDLKQYLEFTNLKASSSATSKEATAVGSEDDATEAFLSIFLGLPMSKSVGQCHIKGNLLLNRAGGGELNLHPNRIELLFGSLKQGIMMYDKKIDLSHTIRKFAFGRHFPHALNGMELRKNISMNDPPSRVSYLATLVPTTYQNTFNRDAAAEFASVDSYQHSVSACVQPTFTGESPEIAIRYDFDPLSLCIVSQRRSLRQLLVRFLGIVGGLLVLSKVIFALVSGVLDAFSPAESVDYTLIN